MAICSPPSGPRGMFVQCGCDGFLSFRVSLPVRAVQELSQRRESDLLPVTLPLPHQLPPRPSGPRSGSGRRGSSMSISVNTDASSSDSRSSNTCGRRRTFAIVRQAATWRKSFEATVRPRDSTERAGRFSRSIEMELSGHTSSPTTARTIFGVRHSAATDNDKKTLDASSSARRRREALPEITRSFRRSRGRWARRRD